MIFNLKPSLLRKLRVALRAIVLLGTAFGLACCDGCSDERDDEPDHGKYRASASLENITFTADQRTAVVHLSVECEGEHLPDNCGSHNPGWVVWTAKTSDLRITIADPSQPQTTALIVFTGDPETFTIYRHFSPFAQVQFQPSSAPREGMTIIRTDVYCEVRRAVSEPDIEELPAGEPSLTAGTGQLFFNGPGSQSVKIAYNGPDTTITAITVGGDPELTLINAPAPGPVSSGSTITVTAGFAGSTNFTDKKAVITVTTANNASATVNLLGTP